MSTEYDWISEALKSARKRNATVPDTVWNELEKLLRGKLSQRAIPAVELAGVARHLLEDMLPKPPSLKEQK